ncbi:peptidase [Gordoniibacillus kamchatkensis]|uniref:Sporulation sigma-E factor-processing peptidase n=2 Tax=Gordoniibacillus kamchatkensis TaxID=1590651 RepID=A0ABR5AMJ0_9BACL|nr:peptidase [Paenibacillus sp. VKM B-2647]
MVVYLDLIFMTNLLMDGAVLATTAWARRKRVVWWRLALASALGAGYVFVLFLPSLHVLFTFAVKSIFSVFMIMTAFGFSSLQNLARDLGMFYFVNFAYAGCMFGLRYLLLSSGDVLNGILLTQTGSTLYQFSTGPLLTVVTAVAAIVLVRHVFVFTKRKQEMTELLAEVTIMIGNVQATCTGLIDTGNQLYDPLTRTPVLVMEAERLKPWLPPAWLERIRRCEVDQLIAGFGGEPFIWQDRLRLVPFRGIGRSTQFMLALKPDRVVIRQGEQTRDITKVLIGLDGGTLSHDSAYQAIIHPAIIAN